jgi:hypothetical protein
MYVHVWYLTGYFLERETFQKNVLEKTKNQQFLLSNLSSENIAVYEVMSKNMVQPDRPQMKI